MKKIILSLIFSIWCAVAYAQVVVDVKPTNPEYTNIVFSFESGAQFVDVGIYKVYKIKIGTKEIEVLDSEVVPFLELKDKNKYTFTGAPGKYKIVVTCYGEKLDKGFAYTQILDGEFKPDDPVNPPGPTPPNPDPVVPDLQGLALEIYKAAVGINSPNKVEEARLMAGCYETVAARAAGLSNMSLQDMATELSRMIQGKLNEVARSNWNSFNSKYVELMRSVPASKEAFIQAYLDVAKGLRAVK